MKKLHLVEDIVTDDELAAGNLITTLIKTEWDSVDFYNSVLLTISDENLKEVENILSEIISNHYIHIGQLEKALQYVNPSADDIDDGKESVEDVLVEN